MDVKHLVHMANQIGEFFEAMPDRPEALQGIVNHVRKFWAPRMRDLLALHLDEQGGEGLRPIVLEAFQQHRAALS